MAGAASDGERLVAAYLRQRGFPAHYEPDVGGRAPDFVAQTRVGSVVLEVFEPQLRLPNTAGAYDSVGPIEGAFKQRKRKQVKAAAKDGLPAIVVIGSANSDLPFDTFSVAGAMFGRPGVTFSIDSATGSAVDEPTSTFLGPGKTQGDVNTSYSALAMIRRFNPTLWRLQAAWHERFPLDPTMSRREVGERVGRRQELADELAERGVWDPDASVARLVILHNPYAAIPLDRDFAGPHDDQHAVLRDDETGSGLWLCVAQGVLRWEVPGEG